MMMRLIDADNLKPDAQWDGFYNCYSAFSISQIDDAPTVKAVPIEVLYELKEEISKLESGWYWRSVSENGVTSFDKDTLSYVHKLIDEKIKELSE